MTSLELYSGVDTLSSSTPLICISPHCMHRTELARLGAGDLFVPLMFLCFNSGDLIGRGLASLGPWAKRSPPTPVLLAYAVARGCLLAALMLCNVITPQRWALPVLFRCVGLTEASGAISWGRAIQHGCYWTEALDSLLALYTV